ncbi:MAG TPA: translocation/assembly module TamB domain-containing protein [Vicinamibacterales bacterium]|nr:translocation/assembly module TamB domain-containing protein [Vicinamibacterales bacterium]
MIEQTEVPGADPAPPERPKGARRGAARRWTKRLAIVISAALASFFITIFSVDIGNITIAGKSIRTLAESQGSKFLKRPLHIGRISALLTPGKFVVEDLRIEGPTPSDRPFFAAKKITVEFPWWTLVRLPRELYVDLHIYGWRMTVENWAEGGARLPNLKRQSSGGPQSFKTQSMAVYAHDGEFVYEDHVSNWGVVCPNLNFALVRAANLNTILGSAQFTKGTTRIGRFLPMSTDFTTRFQLQGAKVLLKHIDLVTDGARSHVNGYVNFANWPEQEYGITSEVDFSRMREIFFANETWRVGGTGTFQGIFKFWKTGRELAGQFTSEEAALNFTKGEWRFPHLHGDLRWTAKEFIVPHAESEFLGGSMRLTYGFPMGVPNGMTTFVADYQDVDLYRFTRQYSFTALEPQGRMRGRVAMTWRGKFSEGMQGSGNTTIQPLAGEAVAAATLPAQPPEFEHEPRAGFVKFKPFGFFPISADLKYRFTPGSLDFEPSWVATPKTYVSFSGHARGGPVNVPFHVTSHDWQNSDRLFTAIMTNFGSQVGAIPVGGRGVFDGSLTKFFNAPRIEGRFSGDQMHAWDVDWGTASGDVVIENNYLDLKNGVITYPGGGRVVTSGRYALGYPRADGGEEINADIDVQNMPLEPLKKAFELVDWPVTGTVASASMHLTGKYEQPGNPARPGTMRLVDGTAWEEPFDAVTSALVFEGNGGLRLRGMRMEKSGGLITGDAWVSWEEDAYSFAAHTEGTGLAVDKLANFKIEQAPLTGQLTFDAHGEGSLDSPAWTMNGQIPDLYAGGEGVGAVAGRISLANETLKIEAEVAGANRLQVSANGEIALNDTYDAKLNMRFTDTSIDPYLKFVTQEMPYSKAIASGAITVNGPLADWTRLNVTSTIEKADLTLFAYALANDGDLRMSLKNSTFSLDQVKFKGAGTELTLLGTVDAGARKANVRATGTASLEALRGFYPELVASGDASLEASLIGAFDDLIVDGRAVIKDGRLRLPSLPHGFDNINGPIVMQKGRISVDQLRATMGEGPVTFGGDIVLEGYKPSEYNLSADGRSLHLRLLDGLRSTVNTHLELRGPINAPVMSGTVDVLTASYSPRIQTGAGYFDLLRGAAEPEPEPLPAPVLAPKAAETSPMMLAIKVRSGVVPFIENNAGTISGTADFEINGTASQPMYTGRITIDRGEWVLASNRFFLQSGLIEFTNPVTLDPFFDVAARTRLLVTGQYYDVNLRATGTFDKLQFSISSEPWLPEFQIISLLLGETADVGRAELLARSAPEELRNQALRTAGVVFLTSPISSTIGSVAERVTAIDTVQIVPQLGNSTDLQQLSPAARITLGKRLSERWYLTYSRTLTTTPTLQNEIILIEFNQSDQVSWILSRNEDRSYALDFRIKYVFR